MASGLPTIHSKKEMAILTLLWLVSFPDPPTKKGGRVGPGVGLYVRACVSAGICAEPIKSTNYNLAGSQSQL